MKPTIVTLTSGDENQRTVATFGEAFGEYSEAEGWKDYNFEGEEDEYYSADGEEDEYYNAKGEKLKGAFKKVGKGVVKGAKKIGGALKKFVGKLKPKKGARKLKPHKSKVTKPAKGDKGVKETIAPDSGKFADVIPPVIPVTTPSGEKVMQKSNPDGTTTVVPPDQTVKMPNGQIVDKKDIEGAGETIVEKNLETGKDEILKIIDQKDVAQLKTEDGEQIPFKKDDLIDKNTKEGGMSKGMKIGLIVSGSLIVLGVISYFVWKSKQGGKGK